MMMGNTFPSRTLFKTFATRGINRAHQIVKRHAIFTTIPSSSNTLYYPRLVPVKRFSTLTPQPLTTLQPLPSVPTVSPSSKPTNGWRSHFIVRRPLLSVAGLAGAGLIAYFSVPFSVYYFGETLPRQKRRALAKKSHLWSTSPEDELYLSQETLQPLETSSPTNILAFQRFLIKEHVATEYYFHLSKNYYLNLYQRFRKLQDQCARLTVPSTSSRESLEIAVHTLPQLEQILSRIDRHFNATLSHQSYALASQLKVADKEHILDAIANPHEHVTYAIASASVAHSYFTLVQQQCEEAQQLLNHITGLLNINDSHDTVGIGHPITNPINLGNLFSHSIIPDSNQIQSEIRQSQTRLRLSHDPMFDPTHPTGLIYDDMGNLLNPQVSQNRPVVDYCSPSRLVDHTVYDMMLDIQ